MPESQPHAASLPSFEDYILEESRPAITLDNFRWQTMDGRTLTEIWQLPTTHLFHCIKMLFNHLAAVHGGFPVHFTREYEDYLLEAEDEQGAQQMAALVCFFIAEIEYRKDLHPKHWPVYLMQSVLNLRTTAPPR